MMGNQVMLCDEMLWLDVNLRNGLAWTENVKCSATGCRREMYWDALS